MNNVLIALSVVFLIAAAVESTRFIVRYRKVTWRRTREGRHLMGFTRAFAASLWATLLLAVLPIPMVAALVVQVLLFGWLAYAANERNRIFTANQREARAGTE